MSCVISGPYPSLINNTAGHKTLVVQAYAHTKVGTVWVVEISNIGTPRHFIVSKSKLRPFISLPCCPQYLGRLRLKFSESGELEDWSGAPILLDSSHAKVGRCLGISVTVSIISTISAGPRDRGRAGAVAGPAGQADPHRAGRGRPAASHQPQPRGEARQPRGRGHARLLDREEAAGRVGGQVRLQSSR